MWRNEHANIIVAQARRFFLKLSQIFYSRRNVGPITGSAPPEKDMTLCKRFMIVDAAQLSIRSVMRTVTAMLRFGELF